MPVPHRAPDSLVGFHTGGRAGPLRRPGGLAPDADEGLPGGLRRLFLGVVSRFPRTRPLFLRARLELLVPVGFGEIFLLLSQLSRRSTSTGSSAVSDGAGKGCADEQEVLYLYVGKVPCDELA